MKPLIGITPEAIQLARPDGRGAFCGVSYAAAVDQAGGLPVILPLTTDTAVLDELLRRCDGVLLAGGGDVAEATVVYGRALRTAERKSLGGVDAVRDEMEVYLVRQLVEQDKPVLGICRGIQIMNVALGGTLLPDVPDHRHRDPGALAHGIAWTQDSRLGQLLGADCPRVNSTHHQAVARVAAALRVAARAEDGLIEAVEVPGMRFGVGVQFHPERLLQVAPQFGRLFRVFVETARPR